MFRWWTSYWFAYSSISVLWYFTVTCTEWTIGMEVLAFPSWRRTDFGLICEELIKSCQSVRIYFCFSPIKTIYYRGRRPWGNILYKTYYSLLGSGKFWLKSVKEFRFFNLESRSSALSFDREMSRTRPFNSFWLNRSGCEVLSSGRYWSFEE